MSKGGGKIDVLRLLFELRDASGRDMGDVVAVIRRMAAARGLEHYWTRETIEGLAPAVGGLRRLRAGVLKALAEGQEGAEDAPAAAAAKDDVMGRLL